MTRLRGGPRPRGRGGSVPPVAGGRDGEVARRFVRAGEAATFPKVAPSMVRSRARSGVLVSALSAALLLASPTAAQSADTVPVRVRILKGSRQGPASVDPKLSDLAQQLGKLAYVRWDEVGEKQADLEFKKPLSVVLPDGATLELTLLDSRKDSVTFEVRVSARGTRSRLTISKDQRIVHQVTDEKAGEAYFATVRPWP
jgi:hypothetical protein